MCCIGCVAAAVAVEVVCTCAVVRCDDVAVGVIAVVFASVAVVLQMLLLLVRSLLVLV